jgi:hypothetical protein
MNMQLDVCVTCHRHIRSTEQRCPFCRATNVHVRSARALPPLRLSRARWAAFGSVCAVVGCSSTHDPATAEADAVIDATGTDTRETAPLEDTLVADTSFDEHPAEVGVADTARDAEVGACPVADVNDFTCGTIACRCQPPWTMGEWSCKDGDAGDAGEATAACLSCLSCACSFGMYMHCVPNEAGTGVARVWTNACYGCPPRRLEGMA